MKINVPPFAAAVIGKLRAGGYEAYAVGGCVRDSMLGRTPNDWDVTTSALPETTLSLFSGADGFKAVPTGIAHGTVTVISGGEPVEVTTFRVDGNYSDHRRPDSVGFTGRLGDDLARRDFTINAMAYSPERGLIDPYGGERDLGKKIIRCVGEPERRFDEDALRILRALRFASTLGFEIEKETAEAAVRLRTLILDISRERVSAELEKLLLGQDAEKILRAYEPVFLTTIPELAYENFGLAAECVGKLRVYGDFALSLAGFFCGLGEKALNTALAGLKLPKKVSSRARYAVLNAHAPLDGRTDVRRLAARLGADHARDTIILGIALGTASPERLSELDDILSSGECISLGQLRIDGERLKALGVRPEMIGRTLGALLSRVISGELANEEDVLVSAAGGIIDAEESTCDSKPAHGETEAPLRSAGHTRHDNEGRL